MEKPKDMSFLQREQIANVVAKANNNTTFKFRNKNIERSLSAEEHFVATLKKHGFHLEAGNGFIYVDKRHRKLPPIDLEEVDICSLPHDIAWDLYVAFVLEPEQAKSRKRKTTASTSWQDAYNRVKRVREEDIAAGYIEDPDAKRAAVREDDEEDLSYLDQWH